MSGFLFPRTPSGRSSLIPPPPWHYSGEMLTVEYRPTPSVSPSCSPTASSPPPRIRVPSALIWADWQSCGDSFEEVLDPVRSQYKECFAVVRCRWRAETWSRCVFIWVDKDFALVRGYHQGYPKKLGSIWMTRPITVGNAGPRLEAGARFGATLAADRSLPGPWSPSRHREPTRVRKRASDAPQSLVAGDRIRWHWSRSTSW